MRLRRLCLAIFAFLRFLREPIQRFKICEPDSTIESATAQPSFTKVLAAAYDRCGGRNNCDECKINCHFVAWHKRLYDLSAFLRWARWRFLFLLRTDADFPQKRVYRLLATEKFLDGLIHVA